MFEAGSETEPRMWRCRSSPEGSRCAGRALPLCPHTAQPSITSHPRGPPAPPRLQAGLAAQAATQVDCLAQHLLRRLVLDVHVPAGGVDCTARRSRGSGGGKDGRGGGGTKRRSRVDAGEARAQQQANVARCRTEGLVSAHTSPHLHMRTHTTQCGEPCRASPYSPSRPGCLPRITAVSTARCGLSRWNCGSTRSTKSLQAKRQAPQADARTSVAAAVAAAAASAAACLHASFEAQRLAHRAPLLLPPMSQ